MTSQLDRWTIVRSHKVAIETRWLYSDKRTAPRNLNQDLTIIITADYDGWFYHIP